ncbi:MAG TPA: uracil-DNA glycosylase [Candidatus Avacidaminococcus intestinavium]|uniref:Uracil-DNA glycosylase n=1 Tax=Candidatus Avacidaminococcus intestinavium TaxID=2840684 RepID=A0A9D1MQ51_9FIRM|nr:uracil-DNA glycosylase [Candidatus Avacidaminococcus intestinavium]
MDCRLFLEELQKYKKVQVFNPWVDYDATYDIGPEAPCIRAANLKRYLELRQNAQYLFIAEGLGYQGGHFSGMAMTSERILLGFHESIKPQSVLGEWIYQRTSNPRCSFLNKKQREEGFNEPTATVMWNVLATHGISPFKAILWNIFPFHPYKANNLLTNRTPDKVELEIGIKYAKMMMDLAAATQIIAIGQKSAITLRAYGIECVSVPHPSMGGANRFKTAVAEILNGGGSKEDVKSNGNDEGRVCKHRVTSG